MNSSMRAADASEPVVCSSLRNNFGSAPWAVSQEQISAVMILFVVAYKMIAILKALGIQASGKQIIVCATPFKKFAAGSIFAFSPPITMEKRPCGIATAGAPLA